MTTMKETLEKLNLKLDLPEPQYEYPYWLIMNHTNSKQ